MDDLHTPLGKKAPAIARDRWLIPGLVCAAVILASILAYVFFDARQSARTVVALNEQPATAVPEQPTSVPKTSPSPAPVEDDEPFDINKVKPLSPLKPLPSDNTQTQPSPVFKPKPVPPKRLSDWVPNPDLVEKSEFGLLPRISQGGVRPLDAYSRSNGMIGANRVAIIVGGLGLSQTGTQSAIKALPSEITLGFSPLGNSLQRWMQTARREGHEVVLQLPMEPLGYPSINPGPRTLTSVASPGENLHNLRWALGRMTNYPLVVNYLGAGLSGKSAALRPILQEIRNRGLGYIDDGAVRSSTAPQLADALRLPNAVGSMIIDANRNERNIKSGLQSLEALAKRTGYAIGSASAFPKTVEIIRQWATEAQKRGIIIVPASSLLKDYGR